MIQLTNGSAYLPGLGGVFMKKIIGVMFLLFTLVFIAGCQNTKENSTNIFNDEKKIATTEDSFKFYDTKEELFNDHTLKTQTKFEGINTLWLLTATKDDTITISYNVKTTAGKLKLVLVDAKQTVTTIFDGTKNDTFTGKIKAGENKLRLIGQDATATLDITVQTDEQTSIKKYDSLDELDKEIDSDMSY